MKPLIALAVLALAASAGAAAAEDLDLGALLGGGRAKGPALEAKIAEAAKHPLGSKDNPARVNMPDGQRAYLRRLRCADGEPPSFSRSGSVGPGPFGSIVDAYRVDCGDSGPKGAVVYMDMYHPEHEETAAPPGFTFVKRREQH